MGGVPGSAAAVGHAGNVHDHAVAIIEHVGQDGLHGIEHAVDIQGVCLTPELNVDIQKGRPPPRRC